MFRNPPAKASSAKSPAQPKTAATDGRNKIQQKSAPKTVAAQTEFKSGSTPVTGIKTKGITAPKIRIFAVSSNPLLDATKIKATQSADITVVDMHTKPALIDSLNEQARIAACTADTNTAPVDNSVTEEAQALPRPF